MREVIRSFQNKCIQTGQMRATVLQKSLAAAIAYSAPCFTGADGDAENFYSTAVMGPAMKVISEVNEMILVDVDKVLADVKQIWLGRYAMLNSPIFDDKIQRFHNSVINASADISSSYDYWVNSFMIATSRKFGA